MNKYGENKFKSLSSDGTLISAVPSHQYSKRFVNFMNHRVIINQRHLWLQGKDHKDEQIAFKTTLRKMREKRDREIKKAANNC